MQQNNLFPIKLSDFKEMQEKVWLYLTKSKWNPKKSSKSVGVDMFTSSTDDMIDEMSGKYADDGPKTANIVRSTKRFSASEEIQNEIANKILNTIWGGMALGFAVSKITSKASGLDTLRALNATDKKLSQDQETEFRQKNQSDAAIAIFTTAHYIVSKLSKINESEVSKRVIGDVSIPELDLLRKEQAIQCVLYYLDSYINDEKKVKDDVDLLKITMEYFQKVLDELFLKKNSISYLENFEGNTYELEGNGFKFTGFDRSIDGAHVNAKVREVRFEHIAGNQLIKLEVKRMIDRLLCYNPKEKRNPMVEMRGLVRTMLGMGIPGTGKTMIIAAMATEIAERCKEYGFPFIYAPLNLDIVSKFQGESAERMNAWYNIHDTLEAIVFAPIDDAESVFARRDGRESSEGSNSILKVSLNRTEGADAIWFGGSIMPSFTNNWEIMDPAWLSRQQKRVFIDGPKTLNDHLDLNNMFFQRFGDKVKLIQPKDYVYGTDQKILTSYSSAVKEEDIEPKNPLLKEVFFNLLKKHDPLKHPEFLAEFQLGITQAFPKIFAARDIRNIQDQVTDKLMDFSFTDEMVYNPSYFYLRDYDYKLSVIKELSKATMNGLSFERIYLQELVKYADINVTINQTAKDKEIEAIVNRYRNEIIARKILKAEGIELN